MYRIIYLPTAEYVIDGHSCATQPEILQRALLKSEGEILKTNCFKFYKMAGKDRTIIFNLDNSYSMKYSETIPTYLFDIVEVL